LVRVVMELVRVVEWWRKVCYGGERKWKKMREKTL
jgi:hypothetical protein